jgi:hypothetical protein
MTMNYDRATGRSDRYSLTTWHGELGSWYHIVDAHAPESEQPAVIETYTDRRQALAILERYNRAHKGQV